MQLRRAHRVRHRGLRETCDGDDVARLGLLDRHAVQTAIGEQLGQAPGLNARSVRADRLHRHVEPRPALLDPAGEHPAEERIVVQNTRDHRERRLGVHLGRRHMAQDQLEQGGQVAPRTVQARIGPALPAGGVERRKVELFVGRTERGEQVEHFGQHLVRPGVRAVNLVDDDDGAQAAGQRLADDELGLGQHALGGVHEHDRAVHHAEDALDLAAEIGVAGRVHDVDARSAPDDAGALGEDRDAALALQVVAVERALGDLLVLAEGPRLAQELVHERRLAVVHVSDDGDVAQVHWGPQTVVRCTDRVPEACARGSK